jgi:hypothetical protein
VDRLPQTTSQHMNSVALVASVREPWRDRRRPQVGRRDPGDLARQASSETASLSPGRRSRLGGSCGRRSYGSRIILAPRQRRPVGEACAA